MIAKTKKLEQCSLDGVAMCVILLTEPDTALPDMAIVAWLLSEDADETGQPLLPETALPDTARHDTAPPDMVFKEPRGRGRGGVFPQVLIPLSSHTPWLAGGAAMLPLVHELRVLLAADEGTAGRQAIVGATRRALRTDMPTPWARVPSSSAPRMRGLSEWPARRRWWHNRDGELAPFTMRGRTASASCRAGRPTTRDPGQDLQSLPCCQGCAHGGYCPSS